MAKWITRGKGKTSYKKREGKIEDSFLLKAWCNEQHTERALDIKRQMFCAQLAMGSEDGNE